MIKRYSFLFGLVFVAFMIFGIFARAEDVPQAPDPEKAMLDAQLEMMKQGSGPDEIPIPESDKDGYWWVKQDFATKKDYIKNIELCLKEKKIFILKLKTDKIIEMLDEVYNPKDNPLDIKMDKSIERMFYNITKEMMIK
jgi:hypothetical protein